MRDTTLYRKALLDRLGELDSRLHHIETELDEPHSKDWEENAVEREGDEVLEQLGHSGEAEIAREFDVEWIEKGILRRVSEQTDVGAPVRVYTDSTKVHSALEHSGGEFAFLVNPPPKRRLYELIKNDWRLPEGSLQIRPQIPRGLLLSALKPAAQTIDSGGLEMDFDDESGTEAADAI